MSNLVTGDGRTHMKTGLMRESLVSRALGGRTEGGKVRAMVPDVNMVSIGGRSIMDRGAKAVLPLVDALAQAKHNHKMVLGVGGGARSRHTQAIGMDLGLPVGGLARIVGGAEEQNRDMLQFLLAPHGGITFIKDHFQDLQLFLNGGMLPICIGQPPYHFLEPPPRENTRLPDNGPDVGLFLMAEVIGAARMIYVKDVDGVYDRDPHQDPGAKRYSTVSAEELLAKPHSLPIERELLYTLQRARLIREVRVINGLQPENLLGALAGEEVGTLITGTQKESLR